jgi:hypothetical protein
MPRAMPTTEGPLATGPRPRRSGRAAASGPTPRAPRTYVAPLSFGLGDLVVSLPAVQGLIEEGARRGWDTWLVTRSPAQAALAGRIGGLGGQVDEAEFDARPPEGDRFIDLRDHPLQRDHWWGSADFEAAFGPLTINDILARICADAGISVDVSRPLPLVSARRPELEGCVVLVAETDGATKSWAPDRWVALADRIGAAGARVAQLTRDEPSSAMRATGIAALRAPTPADAVDVLASCRAVVGVDTGMTHVAVQQGTPTVTLLRPRPVYFRPWPHCRAVVGDECDEACAALERSYAYNDRVRLSDFDWSPRPCPSARRCLEAIGSERVWSELESVAWPR